MNSPDGFMLVSAVKRGTPCANPEPFVPLTEEESAAFQAKWAQWTAELEKRPAWWQTVLAWLALRVVDGLWLLSLAVVLYVGAIMAGWAVLMVSLLAGLCVAWCLTFGLWFALAGWRARRGE